MKCPKCGKQIFADDNQCIKCNYFIYYEILQEVKVILQQYYDNKDYASSHSLLVKTYSLVKNTKYEKTIKKQLEFIEIKLEEKKKEYDSLKEKAYSNLKNKSYSTAQKYFRKMLDYPITKREKIKCENELIRIKANIYNYEMKDLFENKNDWFVV